ncbi:MAG: glycosyltransferase family 4 protein [Acidobacteria bacterium]|nr:glycosyltransferase family 4 protein [Acidobacteriota bacterium]
MSQPERLAAILVSKFTAGHRPDGPVDNGGRPRMVRDLARLLRRLGFHVRIVQRGIEDRLVPYEDRVDVETRAVPLRAWGDFIFARRTRELVERADLCCYASPEDGYPFYSSRSFAIQHGIWWDAPYSGPKAALIERLQKERNLRMCGRVRAVICVDSNFINYLRLLGPAGHTAAQRCYYLPNYADCLRFPAPTQERIRHRFASRTVLFLRRFEEARGGREFVEMCRLLRDRGVSFHARMVGWGAQAQLLQSLIRQLGLGDTIGLSHGDIESASEILDEATISVVPSAWSEGTSLSAIESLVMGVPVVTTDVGGLPNVVTPEFTGAVTRSNPQDLAAAVERLLSSETQYRAMACNCILMRPALSLDRWIRQLSTILTDAQLLTAHRTPYGLRAAGGLV